MQRASMMIAANDCMALATGIVGFLAHALTLLYDASATPNNANSLHATACAGVDAFDDQVPCGDSNTISCMRRHKNTESWLPFLEKNLLRVMAAAPALHTLVHLLNQCLHCSYLDISMRDKTCATFTSTAFGGCAIPRSSIVRKHLLQHSCT